LTSAKLFSYIPVYL